MTVVSTVRMLLCWCCAELLWLRTAAAWPAVGADAAVAVTSVQDCTAQPVTPV